MSFNCYGCKKPDTDEMVQCDKCDHWYHYTCAGVNQDIENKDWSCVNCVVSPEDDASNSLVNQQNDANQHNDPNQQKDPNHLKDPKQNAPSLTTPTTSSTLPRPGDSTRYMALLLQQLEEEKELKEKRDKEYIEKKYALLRSLECPTAELEHGKISPKKGENQQKINEFSKVNSSHHHAALDNTPVHQNMKEPFVNNPINTATFFKSSLLTKMQPTISNPQIVTKLTTFNNTASADTPTANSFESDTVLGTPSPSKQQLAARQLLSKEQVIFSGKSEEWPLFISWFNTSTISCGYTNIENLRRLQNCLKGDALEAVRCRLLLPDQVPGVISTLKLLYGRPEVIINNIIEKIRKEPPPRVEKLQTIIKFSLSVQNMCSVMQASELYAHLTNPCLLQELMGKLPPQLRLEWGCYRRSVDSADLSTFSSWLTDIAHSASEVAQINAFIPDSTRAEKYSPRASLNIHQELEPQSQTETLRECPLCSFHCKSVDVCQQFLNMDLNDRWNAIRRFVICRTCLRKHGKNRCYAVKVCGIDGCSYKHHNLLHKSRENMSAGALVNHHQINRNCILFKIIPVTIHNGNKQINTFAFLDDGSSVSLMDAKIADELGVRGRKQPLCLRWTSNTHRTESDSMSVNIQISSNPFGKKFNVFNIRTITSLCLPTQSINADFLSLSYPYLERIPIESYSNAKPSLLLGLDQWKLTIPLQSREGIENQPVASKTRLGWLVYGPYDVKSEKQQQIHYNYHICDCSKNEDKHLSTLFKEFIAIESADIPINKGIRSRDDDRAEQIIQNNISRDGNRFVVPLLWKFENTAMPDSRQMAERRLLCLEKRMSKNLGLFENLNEQIVEYVRKQYAKKLCKEELEKKYPRVWYLPIFPVINPHKPNKVRIVWDAAAAVNGTSLNSLLLSGPDVVPSLLSVLFRFRERKIAICADIKEMFHQVCVKSSDQHAQRFLWRNKESKQIEEYAMQVLTFGSTCSPFCAQYVKNTNANCYVEKYPRAARAIIQNHYVDDYLDSVDSEEEAEKLAREVIFIHSQAGFEIRNFMSNSKRVLTSLKEKVIHYEKSITNWHILSAPEKILGMWWSAPEDLFSFAIKAHTLKFDIINSEIWPTKRDILKVLMSIFDPLGLIANFLVLLKILLQDIWSSSIEWDDKIHSQHYEKWCRWKEYIPDIKRISIERSYLKKLVFGKDVSVQMHIFVDASDVAYSAVGYLRIACGNIIEVKLIAAKTKVAPIKIISIPRLELEAAVLGIRLAKLITSGHSIDITEKYFWSDSKTVLSWISSDHRKYKQFVAFRVGQILEETEVKNWRWISSRINVADEATKWKSKHNFTSDSIWFRGPDFLYETMDKWPEDFYHADTLPTEEIRHIYLHQVKEVRWIVDVSRFSRWNRLLRTMARIFCLFRISYREAKEKRIKNVLSSVDFVKAENYLIKSCQSESFAEEISILQNNDPGNLKIENTSSLHKLSPYLDTNSVLRVSGRIDAVANVPFCTKRPIILPGQHQITKLIITDCHHRFCHQNDETVVNELRQKFSIPRLRVILKTIKRECQTCKNRRSVPKPTLMGNLPPARLKPFTRPFSYIGIDYFGPLSVTVGRHSEKRWGVLITCLTVRAVHIEVARSLSTDSCIMALKRFIARRGWPVEIYSDNGTNFRGASEELKQAVRSINTDELSQNFVGPNLKWRFIPPLSPHMGGSWERLIRSVKKTLMSISPTRNPSDELLLTMMAEVERIVNSRPLTYVPLDDESAEALTPNHFLLGSSNGEKLAGLLSDEGGVLRKHWLTSEQFANCFWRRWVSEYLPDLTKRTKWFSVSTPIKERDIVIITDPNSPRNSWPKGVVIQTIPGKDGVIRSAVIRTLTGVYTRPVAKLAILDVERFDQNGKSFQGNDLPGGSVA